MGTGEARTHSTSAESGMRQPCSAVPTQAHQEPASAPAGAEAANSVAEEAPLLYLGAFTPRRRLPARLQQQAPPPRPGGLHSAPVPTPAAAGEEAASGVAEATASSTAFFRGPSPSCSSTASSTSLLAIFFRSWPASWIASFSLSVLQGGVHSERCRGRERQCH